MIQLLQKTKSWVDPNLLLLAENSKPNRAKRPKKEKEHNPEKSSPDEEAESDDDSFAALTATRIALKRSEGVSDTSDDDDDEGD